MKLKEGKMFWGKSKFNKALNAIMAEYTYEQLDDSRREVIDDQIDTVMRSAGFGGGETLAFYAAPREIQLGLWATAMKKLGIDPAIKGENWRPTGNPFKENAWDEVTEEEAYEYLKKTHGIDLLGEQ